MPAALSTYLAQRGADFLIAPKLARHDGFRLIRDRP